MINDEHSLEENVYSNLFKKLATFPSLKSISITFPNHNLTCKEIHDTL